MSLEKQGYRPAMVKHGATVQTVPGLASAMLDLENLRLQFSDSEAEGGGTICQNPYVAWSLAESALATLRVQIAVQIWDVNPMKKKPKLNFWGVVVE